MTTYLPMKYEYLKKRVHEQYPIRLYRARIQQHRLRRPIKTVTVQHRLYHDKTLSKILPIQHVPIERRLIRTVVKNLEKLTPPQVKHELRIQRKVLCESERIRIVLVVLSKLLAESDEHPVYPAEDVGAVVGFGAVDG